MLDLANFTSINVSMADNTAWVQTGADIGEVYVSSAQQSATRSFPTGWCPTVGVGGQFSGGGFGSLMRKCGLSADNIFLAWLILMEGFLIEP